MEDSFVIVDVKKGMLHLMRTSPPMVVSLDSTELAQTAEALGATASDFQGFDETQKLLWVAYLLSSGQPEGSTLQELQDALQAIGADSKSGDTCIALRYVGPTPSIDLLVRRKR